jgi:hypothetical protein
MSLRRYELGTHSTSSSEISLIDIETYCHRLNIWGKARNVLCLFLQTLVLGRATNAKYRCGEYLNFSTTVRTNLFVATVISTGWVSRVTRFIVLYTVPESVMCNFFVSEWPMGRNENSLHSPNDVTDFFSIYLILPAALGPGVCSASNRNEYQKQKNVYGE